MTNHDTLPTPPAHARRIGWWTKGSLAPETGKSAIESAIQRVGEPICIVEKDGQPGIGRDGRVTIGNAPANVSDSDPSTLPLLAYIPALPPPKSR